MMNKGEMREVNRALNNAEEKADIQISNMKNEIEAIRGESRILGFFDKIRYDLSHNEFLKYAALYQIKQKKEYCKKGMTWKEFCDEIGESRKTVEDKIKDIQPVVEKFMADFATFSGVPFSKIRYLGRSIAAESATFDNDNILIDGVKIPLSPENKDEIIAVIDDLKEAHKKEKEDLLAETKKLKKNVEKNVEEETKSLLVEREALVKENKRLKIFDPEGKDLEWSVEQMEVIRMAAYEFAAACRRFKIDDRIKDDLHIQAKVEGKITEVLTLMVEVEKEWMEEFNLYRD